MPYAVVWRLAAESINIKMISDPELIEAETDAAAKAEGRALLTEIAPAHRAGIMPLAVVEVSDETLEVLRDCDKVFIPAMAADDDDDDELVFRDISSLPHWQSQPWWSRNS